MALTAAQIKAAKATGKMLVAPGRADTPFDVNTQAVVEFYSQKL